MSSVVVKVGSVELLSDGLCNDIAAVYCSVGWGSGYEASFIRRLYVESGFFVVALNGGECVGVLRALTDGCLTTWIAEIVVKPDFQRKGVGREMMNQLKEGLKHTAIYSDP